MKLVESTKTSHSRQKCVTGDGWGHLGPANMFYKSTAQLKDSPSTEKEVKVKLLITVRIGKEHAVLDISKTAVK